MILTAKKQEVSCFNCGKTINLKKTKKCKCGYLFGKRKRKGYIK